jgi:spore germination protein GerM
MNRRNATLVGAGVAITVALTWLLFFALPRWYARPAKPAGAAAAEKTTDEGIRKIKARLFFVADDGQRLVAAEREVPFADEPGNQARAILEAQLAPAAAPLVSAIPAGTTLRGVFVTGDGSAFVDLSPEVASAHPGGSLNELLTVYTVVHALTFNMPAITSVQLLVNGKEVDTLVGHIDLRRPLATNVQFTIEN